MKPTVIAATLILGAYALFAWWVFASLVPAPKPSAPILNKPKPKHAIVEIYTERGIYTSATERVAGL